MSLMYEEALFSGKAVAAQGAQNKDALIRYAKKLADNPPQVLLTVARGSSDHAANYLSYLAMQRLGIPVVSLPLSIMTLHKAPLQVKNQLAVAFSQSGKSPDLVGTMEALAKAGARTVAMVNAPDSPLEKTSEFALPLCAGEEKSVAATKSYITCLSAAARFVAHWQNDAKLLAALEKLPAQLDEAAKKDWSKAIPILKNAERAMVIGRGLSFSIALEAALKFKETCVIQAEAFSSAEVKHGPMALIDKGYPLLVFAPKSPEQAGLIALAEEMRARGAHVLLAAPKDVPTHDLEIESADDEALNPLLVIQSFYVMVAKLSEARGLNPDVPKFLAKVTCTV